jgi:hypothetical protein
MQRLHVTAPFVDVTCAHATASRASVGGDENYFSHVKKKLFSLRDSRGAPKSWLLGEGRENVQARNKAVNVCVCVGERTRKEKVDFVGQKLKRGAQRNRCYGIFKQNFTRSSREQLWRFVQHESPLSPHLVSSPLGSSVSRSHRSHAI